MVSIENPVVVEQIHVVPSSNNETPCRQNKKTTWGPSIKHFFTLPKDKGRHDVTFDELQNKASELQIDDIKTASFEKIGEAMQALEEKHHYPKCNLKTSTLAGCPKNIQGIFKHSPTLQAFERHSLYEMIKECGSYEAALEILTKSWIYRESNVNDLVPMPHPDDPTVITYYKVAQKIITGEGFTAALLVPISENADLKPIFVISGSNFHPGGIDSISTALEDMRRKLGKAAYLSAVKELTEMMKGIEDGSLIVTGHSLGGNLAQWVAANFTEKLSRLVSYNGTGICDEAHKLFAENSKKRTEPLQISYYQTFLDIVHEVGGPLLGFKAHNTKSEKKDTVKESPIKENELLHEEGIEEESIKEKPVKHEDAIVSLTRFKLANPLKTLAHTYLCLSNPCGVKLNFDLVGKTALSKADIKKCNGTIREIHGSKINSYLNNWFRDYIEFNRKLFGGCMIAPVLQLTRCVVRFFFGTRAKKTMPKENVEIITLE